MGASNWITEHWFDLLQTVGIVGSLLFTAYTTRKDERARKIGNSIAINEQYRQNWKELYEHPKLLRVLAKDVDLEKEPIAEDEKLFVNMLIVHLSTVYRAMKYGEFVKLEGLQTDVVEFFSLPIPSSVWEKIKPLQDKDFVEFIEACLRGK
jgi:hypothetical protein